MNIVNDIGRKFFKIKKKGEFEDEDEEDSKFNHHQNSQPRKNPN